MLAEVLTELLADMLAETLAKTLAESQQNAVSQWRTKTINLLE